MTNLKDKTLFISGASRGIGKAIALRAAEDGARIAVAAKTKDPHPRLPGTIYTAKEEIEKKGGQALALVCDIRFEDQIEAAVDETVKTFGGIDILVNNASAISLTDTTHTPLKRFDLMHQVNVRGTFACTQKCLPHLMKSENPHILNNAPPISLKPKWFQNHVAYTISKYGMSMCVLGMAEEWREHGIAVNALWPKTAIATAAMAMLGGPDAFERCRKPEIMADAAYTVLTQDSKQCTGNFFIDEEILRNHGTTDFDVYAFKPGASLLPDFFLDKDG